MRHLIVLSGNSLKNKAWGESAINYFASQYDSAFMQMYNHWESGEANINFAAEEAKLAEHVASLPAGTNVTLMAKSAGSLLAFLSIYHKSIIPANCIFFGIPFDLAAENLFVTDWSPIDSFSIPAIAFHNVDDPTTSYDFTKTTLATHAPHVQFVTTNESDHWYGDFATYDTFINE